MNYRTTTQSLTRVAIAAAAILAFGLAVNGFTPGEGWSVFDYVLAMGLVGGAVLAWEMAAKRPGTLLSAILSTGLAAAGGAAVIVGEVDDAPGLIMVGFAFVLTAGAIGYRAVRARGSASTSGY